MHGRQLPARDYRRLKEATEMLVDALGGPAMAALVTRIAASQLSRSGNPHEPVFGAIDVIADLESEAGEPIVTRVLADLLGFDLVPRERPETVGVARITEHLGAIGAASGGTLAAMAEAVRDGKIDKGELIRMATALRAQQRETAEALADVDAAIAGQPGGLRLVEKG